MNTDRHTHIGCGGRVRTGQPGTPTCDADGADVRWEDIEHFPGCPCEFTHLATFGPWPGIPGSYVLIPACGLGAPVEMVTPDGEMVECPPCRTLVEAF